MKKSVLTFCEFASNSRSSFDKSFVFVVFKSLYWKIFDLLSSFAIFFDKLRCFCKFFNIRILISILAAFEYWCFAKLYWSCIFGYYWTDLISFQRRLEIRKFHVKFNFIFSFENCPLILRLFLLYFASLFFESKIEHL